MNTKLYVMTARTNLHVGSGDANYGIIDNLVQRDPLTRFPSVHESSLKGAIKAFFVHRIMQDAGETDAEIALEDTRIKQVFGSPKGQGNYRFFGGQLLLFPVRTNRKPYLLATCPHILTEFIAMAKLMGVRLQDDEALHALSGLPVQNSSPLVFDNALADNTTVEYPEFQTVFSDECTVPALLGNANNFVLLSDHDFGEVCGENKLPVLARNHLEDGRSTNLWYEEIVPRQSRFYCFIADASPSSTLSETADYFADNMLLPMQLGANASIGYGLVKFEKQAQP